MPPCFYRTYSGITGGFRIFGLFPEGPGTGVFGHRKDPSFLLAMDRQATLIASSGLQSDFSSSVNQKNEGTNLGAYRLVMTLLARTDDCPAGKTDVDPDLGMIPDGQTDKNQPGIDRVQNHSD